MAFIYKITNTINNKIYIGETNRTIETRWKQHKARAKDLKNTEYLYNAMRFYGINNFFIEELEQCEPEKRFERETYYILLYDTLAPAGYNLILSQNGPTPEIVKTALDYWNEGLSIVGIGNKLHVDPKTISQYLKSNGISQEEIFKRRAVNIGKYSSKTVIQYTLAGDFIKEWESASLASKELNLNNASISKACKGTLLTYNNCIWQYKEADDIENLILKIIEKKKIGKNCKEILQLDENKKVIRKFASASEAGRYFNKAPAGISYAARKGTKAYNYYWKYSGE